MYRSIPFHYESGNVELFPGLSLVSLKEGAHIIVGQKRGVMAWILFHLSLPIRNQGSAALKDEKGEYQEVLVSLGNERHEVDYIID